MNREVRGPETGGATPRSGTGGGTLAVVAVGLVLLLAAPISVPIAVATVAAVITQVRRHWWEPAAVALAALVGIGVVLHIETGSVLEYHFAGHVEALTGGGSWLAVFAASAALGVPLGVLAGCGYVGFSQSLAGGAEWHPIEQRRRAVETSKKERRVAALLRSPEAERACTAPPLGVFRDGDLASWIQGPYVVPPPAQFPAMGVVGESGSGKTVTIERMVTIWARSGRKLFLMDCKGSDPELAERIVAAYKRERPGAACALWPAQPFDMWRGSPVEITNRLLQVQDYTEPYYKSVASTAVRLAMLAPDVDNRGPVRDSASFMARLDADFLTRAYEGRPHEMRDVASVVRKPEALDGVRLRYSGFFSALAGRLDYGFGFEDVDLAVFTVPTLGQREDAMAVARMVLTDFGGYCLRRKPRRGEDVTFVVDEFSAVTSAAPMVIDLAERVRDVNGQVVVSAQSYEGLGENPDERGRMLKALAPGGVIVHRLSDPDEIVKIAGTVRAVEQSWQLDQMGASGLATVKMHHKMRVDPDAVRQARTGEAWVLTQGRAVRMSVIRSRIPPELRDRAHGLVGQAWMQARGELEAGLPPEAQPWWEVPVLGPPPKPLEAGGLLELVAGTGDLPAGPTPPELSPGPTPPDPRVLLLIAAYVRAGQIARAHEIAENTEGLLQPAEYVAELVQRRVKAVQEPKASGAAPRRPRRRRR